jgi:ferrous iron transport protein B
MWSKGVQYLKKMGGVILVASILIWALGYYPKNVTFSKDYEKIIEQAKSNQNLSEVELSQQLSQIELQKLGEQQEQSYIGQLGHAIAPIIRPLGFDWKIGVCIVTGLAAKEIVVSTMGVLYQADFGAHENSGTLVEKIQQQEYTRGEKIGQKVYSLIYFPCVAVIAAIKKEGNWQWAVFTMVYTTGLAWILSFLTFQIGSWFI